MIAQAIRAAKRRPFNPWDLFLWDAPWWYKVGGLAIFAANYLVYQQFGAVATGWCVLLECIAFIALTLMCIPHGMMGGLIVQGLVFGLMTMEDIGREIEKNMPILFLLVMVVPAVFLLKDFLGFVFIRIILRVRHKLLLPIIFLELFAVLSAFVDAVTAISIMSVVVASLVIVAENYKHNKALRDNPRLLEELSQNHAADWEGFQAFLRRLKMHALIGTTQGGSATLLGEPQNVIFGNTVGWDFGEYFATFSPITAWVSAAYLLTCILLEKAGWKDYGSELPENVRQLLIADQAERDQERSSREWTKIWVQGLGLLLFIGVLLAPALGLTLIPSKMIYLIGGGLFIFLGLFGGVTKEEEVGHSAVHSYPFFLLLAMFFAIIAMIESLHLFAPVMGWVVGFEGMERLVALFLVSGAISMISDNAFVGGLQMGQLEELRKSGQIGQAEYEKLAVAANSGTNIPSVATPNGQAAFLFVVQSEVAKHIKLSYLRMMLLAFPYFVSGSLAAVAAIIIHY